MGDNGHIAWSLGKHGADGDSSHRARRIEGYRAMRELTFGDGAGQGKG
jgi:hypothetical protein